MSIRAVGLLVLVVTVLIAALLTGQRDPIEEGVGPDRAPETATTAVEVARDLDGESVPQETARQFWVLEFGGRGQGSGSPLDPSAESDSDGGTFGEGLNELPKLPSGNAELVFSVQDASGRPFRDVSLLLKSLNLVVGAERIVTGADGEARFPSVAPGAYSYLAQAAEGPERAADVLRLEPGERKFLTVRLADASLSISGRVRNQLGEPVAGIGVSVVRHHFASAVTEAGTLGAPSRKTTRSDANGEFAFGELEEGEYDVMTNATNRYPAVQTMVQAGANSVDLILVEGLRIAGTVASSTGEPLDRVWVGLDVKRDRSVLTDADGRYALRLDATYAGSDAIVRFYLRGYEEERLPLSTREIGVDGRQLDVALRPVENAAPVTGIVESERGQPIAGATIVLGSKELGTHYQAVTGEDGVFSIPDTKVGRGYHLRVLPADSYLDYSKHQIHVQEDGRSFEIVLESLATGRLLGRMIDAQGNPVVGFRLWLVASGATRSAVPISSDDLGDFELLEAPAGSLSFDTRSSPRLAIQGVVLPEGGEREVALVLDWGAEELTGEVVDQRGDPIPGAEVSLSWSHVDGYVRSSSLRTTRTSPIGSFRFSQLGPDEHGLEVRAPAYRTVRERHDVGRNAADVEVRLELNGP